MKNDIKRIETNRLLAYANAGLGGNTETPRFQEVTGCPYSYSGVTQELRNRGCSRVWVAKEVMDYVPCGLEESRDVVDSELVALPAPIRQPEEDIHSEMQISSGTEIIELSKSYESSRHTLPMDNNVYVVLEGLMKRYEDRGAVVNALLSYSLMKLEEGEIVLYDGDQESRIDALNKFYHRN